MVFNWFKRLFCVFLGFGVTTLAIGMDMLSLLAKAANTLGPVAIRDYPLGCQLVMQEEPSTKTQRSRRRQRLSCENKKSEQSQGDGAQHASSTSGNGHEHSSYQSFPLEQDVMMDSTFAIQN